MNDFVQKPNKGSMFLNKWKKGDNHPDFKGSVFIDKDMLIELVKNRNSELIEIKLDAWKKSTKDGKPWLSMSVDTYKKQEATDKDPWDQ
jgi:hypothetical protein